MNLFRRIQKQRQKSKKNDLVAPVEPNDAEVGEAELENLRQQEIEQREATRRREEMRNNEIRVINDRVDSTLSNDSEKFIKSIKQPGGQ